jgi:hypothetical protein
LVLFVLVVLAGDRPIELPRPEVNIIFSINPPFADIFLG